MLLTVSTVKDTLDNVQFFVSANLASGVDHMVVFLDAPRGPQQREVAAWLADQPHVTGIATDRDQWWSGDRPHSLNVRQRTNANWARALLAPFPWAEWLFHIDGDEVACLDRAALAEVPASVNAVRLAPWEAVSQWSQPIRPTAFKRLLDEDDLNLLHVLGAVEEPSNQAYFHGHVMGKSGIRPRSGIALSLHDAVAADGTRLPSQEDPRLRVLHYDSPSGEEFVRKWTALAEAGPTRFRSSRRQFAHATQTLVTGDFAPATRDKYLRQIYDASTRDDVELLGDLGYLTEHQPDLTRPTARPLPDGAAAELAARVVELSAGPKAGYFVDDAPDPSGRRRVSGLLRRLSPR